MSFANAVAARRCSTDRSCFTSRYSREKLQLSRRDSAVLDRLPTQRSRRFVAVTWSERRLRASTSRGSLSPRVGHPSDGLVKLTNVDGFGEVLGEAGLEAHGHIVSRTEPAQGDSRCGSPDRQLADEIQPAPIGQLDIADDQIVGVRFSQSSRGAEVVRRVDLVAALLEQGGHVVQGVAVIIDQEDCESYWLRKCLRDWLLGRRS